MVDKAGWGSINSIPGDSMENNICKFVNTVKHNETINIINFVYEKQADFQQTYLIVSTYSLAIVTNGGGVLHTSDGAFPLERGCLFMTFSAKPYYIENSGDLAYIYISFMGLRASALIERLKISYNCPVLSGFEQLIGQWENAFSVITDANTDLICEGLLLHTFGHICGGNDEKESTDKSSNLLKAKQYVDQNYTDSMLDLNFVSHRFSYDPKYFSAAFKRMVRVNFSEYLKDKRLEYAVTLIKSGITGTAELAELCGYKDPLYFSKCFKKKYGTSVKNWYLNNI